MEWAVKEREKRAKVRQRSICLLVIGVLLASLIVGYGLYRMNKSYVVAVNPIAFEKNAFSQEGLPWLIGFYIPGKHDDWVTDILEPLGYEASSLDLPLHVGAVGTTPTHRDFGRKFNVVHWPSIEIVLGETVYPFDGNPRDLLAVMQFMRSGWQDQRGQPRKDLRMQLGPNDW